MVELWYSDEAIGETAYVNVFPSEGDIIVWEYDGEDREFLVDKIRNYFPIGKPPHARIYLKAHGSWDFMYGAM